MKKMLLALFTFFQESKAPRGHATCPRSFCHEVSDPGFKLNTSDLSPGCMSHVCECVWRETGSVRSWAEEDMQRGRSRWKVPWWAILGAPRLGVTEQLSCNFSKPTLLSPQGCARSASLLPFPASWVTSLALLFWATPLPSAPAQCPGLCLVACGLGRGMRVAAAFQRG